MLARYFMYSQVYFHPVRRIYDLHLMEFLRQWLVVTSLAEERFGGDQYSAQVRHSDDIEIWRHRECNARAQNGA
jgi:HD superfamily phosphohydrolase